MAINLQLGSNYRPPVTVTPSANYATLYMFNLSLELWKFLLTLVSFKSERL